MALAYTTQRYNDTAILITLKRRHIIVAVIKTLFYIKCIEKSVNNPIYSKLVRQEAAGWL